MTTPTPSACANCGALLSGPFCAACGQEDRPLDLSMRELLAVAWETVTNFEGRAVQSLGRLFSSPGFLTCEYLAGRRVRWISPVRLYFVVSIVYFGLTSLTGWGALEIDVRLRADSDVATQEELRSLGFASQAELDAAGLEALGTWLPRAMFVLVPILAGLVGAVHRDAGRTFPQNLVFSLHVHAAIFGAFTLAALVTGPVGGPRFDGVVQGLSLGYAPVYLVTGMRAVYGGSLRRNLVLGGVVGVTYWLLALAVTLAIVLPIVFAAGR